MAKNSQHVHDEEALELLFLCPHTGLLWVPADISYRPEHWEQLCLPWATICTSCLDKSGRREYVCFSCRLLESLEPNLLFPYKRGFRGLSFMVSSDSKLRPQPRVSFLWPHFNPCNLPLFYQLPYTLPRTGRGVKRSVSTHRTPRGSRKSHRWQKNSWDHVTQLPGAFWGRLGRRGAGPWAWSGQEERQGAEKVKGRVGKCIYGEEKGALATGSQQTDSPQHPGFFIHSFKTYHRKALCPPAQDTMMN